MKNLWIVLVDKIKEVESAWVLLGVGIFSLVALLLVGSVVNNVIDMIVRIAEVIAGVPAV